MRIQSLLFLLICQVLFSCQTGQDQCQPLEIAAATASGEADLKKPSSNIIYKSEDGGKSWQDVSAGLPEEVFVGCIYVSDGQVYLGAGDGLYQNSNPIANHKWEKALFSHKSISDIFQGQNGLYMSSYEDGLFQQIAGADVWVPVGQDVLNKAVGTAFESKDGSLFVGYADGIFKSSDAGKTWRKVLDQEFISNIVEVEAALLCGTRNGLMRSTDGGESWAPVLSGHGMGRKIEHIGNRLVAIMLSEGKRQGSRNENESQLHSSEDGGKTWQRMDQNLAAARQLDGIGKDLPKNWRISDVKQSGDYLFCSIDSGVFRSADFGKTWEPVLANSGRASFSLGASGKVLYAVLVEGC